MKGNVHHTEFIRSAFGKMKSLQDFVDLLNAVGKEEYGPRYSQFKLNQITWFAFPVVNPRRYKKFTIKKKNGTTRIIHAPIKGLKNIQRILNIILQVVYQPHEAAYGFVPDKSIVDGATLDVQKLFVYNIDLKDFFPSIDRSRVWARLKVPPFNLGKDVDRLKIADIIAQLCCHEMEVERLVDGNWANMLKNVLPQGAPTSPTITNAICEQLDRRLSGAARRFGVVYTRYADDITFSSNQYVFKTEGRFLVELRRIVAEQNFQINDGKTRLQKKEFRQEVTGLVVNEKTNTPSRYIKEIRKWLYYWEQYGYGKASSFFLQAYYADKGHLKPPNAKMENVLDGKLLYLKMVRGADDTQYTGLARRYNALMGTTGLTPESIKNDKVFKKPTDVSGLPFIFSKENIDKLDRFHKLFVEKVQQEKKTFKHRPKDVADVMKLFDDPGAFKDLTHENYKHSFDVAKYLAEAHERFLILTRGSGAKYIPASLYSIIDGFAFSTPPDWWHDRNKIKEGWQSPAWKDWSEKHGKHPLLNPDFDLVAQKFKASTRIRTNNFKKFFEISLIELLGDDFQKLDIAWGNVWMADFYTNTDVFSIALKSLFKNVKDDHFNFPCYRLKYESKEIGGYFERTVYITNLMSYSSKDITELAREIYSGKGNLGTAAQYFFGYCDWSIVNMHNGQVYSVNIFHDGAKPIAEELQAKCDGFTHILTFYQKIE